MLTAQAGSTNKGESVVTLVEPEDVLRSESKLKEILGEAIRVLTLVVKEELAIPRTRKQAQKKTEWPLYNEAEFIELGAFNKHGVWELVPPPDDANVVGTRWVYDIKMNLDGTINRYKARLVAQGYAQVEGIDYNDTFAPTMHIKSMRTLLCVAAHRQYDVRAWDVSTAFLHASLEEAVYVKQPPGHEVAGKENWVYKLNKAMYGLKNAPLAWSKHLMQLLTNLGFTQSSKDECLWVKRSKDRELFILFHVDDLLVVGDPILRELIFAALGKEVALRDEGESDIFLGVEIERTRDGGFVLRQRKYIETLAKRFNVTDDTASVRTPCLSSVVYNCADLPVTEKEKNEAKKLPMQSLLGGLIFTIKTRWDVAYAISDVTRFMSYWGKSHFKGAMRILKYLYATRDRGVVISPDPNENLVMSVYCDANWLDSRDHPELDEKYKPQGGHLVFVGNSLVNWSSRRQGMRTLSSMEAEYYAASEAAKDILWFREILEELGYPQKGPTVIWEDNSACISYSKNNTAHDRSKHIDNRKYFVRDLVKNGECKLVHVSTDYQLADMLTKAQPEKLFIAHRDIVDSLDIIPPLSAITGNKRLGLDSNLFNR